MARGMNSTNSRTKIEDHYSRLSLLACVAVAAISLLATYVSSGRPL
jgi:hypothetical protein